ncbi:hypothetical protein [Bowmanella sp. JS7-9]|uniref:HdeA/HdeB family protein n=1 Tax=Pseudobowmanella zhangzhouensis TaxID=1537679 RepID=A0ABW1XN66_9ALTE|nr:hypothetical protein [Bowmanella sp. JS7-9]TBX23688.1 hypothetical protein TK45_06180 [Bowmanella sp. JS7-9]
MIKFNRIIFTLFTLCSALVANAEDFKKSAIGLGNFNCAKVSEHLQAEDNKSMLFNAWMAGYFSGKNVYFLDGKSPASATEYEEVLLPHLQRFCADDPDASLIKAMESYLMFKVSKQEVIVG